MPVPGRPHLMSRISVSRSSTDSRRLAPSGIWLSSLRPSPAQPWQAWQLPFCRNNRAPAAISAGSGICAWAIGASSSAATAATITGRPCLNASPNGYLTHLPICLRDPRAKSGRLELRFRGRGGLAAATAVATVSGHAIRRRAGAGPDLLVVGRRCRRAAARNRLGPQARPAGVRPACARTNFAASPAARMAARRASP